jgi:hypothetical protein
VNQALDLIDVNESNSIFQQKIFHVFKDDSSLSSNAASFEELSKKTSENDAK